MRVGENSVSLRDLLKPFLGARFFVAVRMVFQRKLAEGILDCFLVGVTGNTKDFVIVALGYFSDTSPSRVALPSFFKLGIHHFFLWRRGARVDVGARGFSA